MEVRVALVSLTITEESMVFSNARCPNCGRWLMAVPGEVKFTTRLVRDLNNRKGDGRTVNCHNCGEVEIVEHHG